MPIEEIAEVAGRFVGRVLLDFLFHTIVEVVGFFLGFWTLRVLSLGRYPSGELTVRQIHSCQILGTLELMTPIVLFAYAHFTA